MYWITLEQIQCFQEVIESGSFSKASLKLNKAKSAVMYSVKNLEEQLGFALLDRSQYRPQITPKGEAFLISSQKVLKEMQELHASVNLIASNIEMRLKISASGIFDSEILYPILKQTMRKFPSTEVLFEKEILSGEKMLSEELVDLAIFENLTDPKSFDLKIINQETLKLVIASEHEFLKLPKAEQTKEKLFIYPQVIQRSTLKNNDLKIGIHENALKWKVTDTPSKKEVILNGLGWGRLPVHTIKEEIKSKKLTHLSQFKDDDTVTFYLGKKKGKAMGKVAEFIWNSF